MNICKEPNCNRPVKGYGLCSKHYQRLKRNGDTNLHLEYNGPRKKFPREYKIWDGMNQRCNQPSCKIYHNYGGRGIKICDRWQGVHGFAMFIEDMGPCPDKCSIDRIDVNGDYCPENCRWATPRTQACNKRNNLKVPGVTPYYSGKGWMARYRCNGKNLFKHFYSYEEAIEQRLRWEKENPLD